MRDKIWRSGSTVDLRRVKTPIFLLRNHSAVHSNSIWNHSYMACASQCKRRLLYSIIRAPTLTHRDSSIWSSTQIRSFHAASPRWQERLSITFGSHIDNLLQKERDGIKDLSTDGHRDQVTKRTLTGKSAIESIEDNFNGQNVSLSSNTTHAAQHGSESSPADDEMESAVSHRPTLSVNSHVSDRDQFTLELSSDAYETISQSGRPQDRSKLKSRLDGHRGHSTENPSRRQTVVDQRLPSASRLSKEVSARTEVARPVTPIKPRKRTEPWQIQKDALQKKFGEQGWQPRKKLSPDAMEGIRSLHEQDQERYTTEILAQQFKMSPEAIRRILKSKWRPSPEKLEERRERWARRHDRIWDQKAALGLRPPRKQDRAPEGPEAFEEELRAKQMLGHL